MGGGNDEITKAGGATVDKATVDMLHDIFSGQWTPGAYGIWIFGVGWTLTQIFKVMNEWRATRKLSLEERQANREGFTAQVEALKSEVEGLRVENRSLRKEYDDHRRICQEETDQLRSMVVHLQNRLSGLFRKLADVAVRVTRHDVDEKVVAAILELAKEATEINEGRV